ncbi:MAG: hypothetical protein M3Y37_11280 [Chloroflexota bacterium]|nr:hypothetical protein [Chloroflexota bacterium]
MADRQQQIEKFYSDVATGTMSRREIVKGGFALGLSLAALAPLVAQAQDATPAATPSVPTSPAANGPVNVPIVGRDMTFDEIKAAIAEEGEVTVGNWTYTANDQLVEQFQNYVKTVYDVDITLNYVFFFFNDT